MSVKENILKFSGQVMRVVLLAILLISTARALAVSTGNELYSVVPGQVTGHGHPLLVQLNKDLVFTEESPLKLATQSPFPVNFFLPEIGEKIAIINRAKEISDGGHSYTGDIQGSVGGTLNLNTVNQTLLGSITLDDGRKYIVSKGKSGSYTVKKKGKSTIPFRCETCEVGGEKPKGKIQKLSRSPSGQDRPGQYSLQGEPIVVDVLALYTEKARKGAGASSNEPNNQDHIKNLFQDYINKANEALKNSGLDVEFNVVHKKEVDFKEPEKELALQDTIYHMVDGSDGILDEIDSLKKKYKPDLVSLLVSTQFGKSWDQIRAGGSGFISGRAFTAIDFRHFNDDGMYSTVNIAYVNDVYELSDLNLAHELGHNFGCNHDRDNYNRDGGLYDYGHGHTFKVKGTTGAEVFCRTIMAYQSDLNEREIPYFSNPDVNFFKVPTGVKEGRSDSANNAKVIRLTAPLVAQINGGEEEANKPPVIVEMFPDEGDVIDVSVDGYITFYDPDGEVESLSFNGSLVDKEYWEKLDNGYWKLTIEWDDEEPDTSYSFEVVVVDNDGAEAKKRISFKIKKEYKPPVIVEVFPKEGSVVDVSTDPYIVFYDPDGEVDKLYYHGSNRAKRTWVKQQNGYWRHTAEWWKLKPNKSYSIEVKVVDNDGAETKQTINFKTSQKILTSIVLLDSGYIEIKGIAPKDSVVDVEVSTDLNQWSKMFSLPTPRGDFQLNFDSSSENKEYFRVKIVE